MKKRLDIKGNSGAQHIDDSGIADPAGKQVKRKPAIFVDYRVTCIGTTLKTDNNICIHS